MYYPYLRGKQFELLALRDLANELDAELIEKLVPIIEPVKANLNGLSRTLETLDSNKQRYIVVINPGVGDFSEDASKIVQFINSRNDEYNLVPALRLTDESSIEDLDVFATGDLSNFEDIAIIHDGFRDSRQLIEYVNERISAKHISQIYMSGSASRIYMKKLRNLSGPKVQIDDFFSAEKKNADYSESSYFTDIHILYADEMLDGFGDYQIVGKEYSESGGPAYAVAVHLSYVDSENDDLMFVRHYVSDTNNTPADPANKFAEAMNKFTDDIEKNPNRFYSTFGLNELGRLVKDGHFPGLGYVKKLSIKHHIETVLIFLKSQ